MWLPKLQSNISKSKIYHNLKSQIWVFKNLIVFGLNLRLKTVIRWTPHFIFKNKAYQMMLKTITLFVLVIALTSTTPIFKKESNKGISLVKNSQCGEAIGEVARPPNANPDPPVNPPIEQVAEETEQLIEQAGGFAGESYLRISLIWDNCNDLDLWLEEPMGGEPEGEKIFYSNK